MLSHLESIEADLELAGNLRGVDIVVASGSEEFLSNNPGMETIPGFNSPEEVLGNYPLEIIDPDGRTVYLVSTPGQYAYLGQLQVSFDGAGEILEVGPSSGPVPVVSVDPDQELESLVVQPVVDFVNNLSNNIIGATEIDLDASVEEIFQRETNLGNLAADALLWEANFFGFIFGAPFADAAVLPAGSMPNSLVIPASSPISEKETFELLPLPEFVSIVEAVTPGQFKQVMERAVSEVENAG